MASRGRTPKNPVGSAAKSAPATPPVIEEDSVDDIIDELLDETEKLKNELIDYHAKQAARTMSPAEKAIRKSAEKIKKAGSELELEDLIISEREKFGKLATETLKEEYIRTNNPPRPKPAAKKAAGKK